MIIICILTTSNLVVSPFYRHKQKTAKPPCLHPNGNPLNWRHLHNSWEAKKPSLSRWFGEDTLKVGFLTQKSKASPFASICKKKQFYYLTSWEESPSLAKHLWHPDKTLTRSVQTWRLAAPKISKTP